MFPIDSIKTRMQMNLSNSEISRGLLKSLSKISSTEGFYALWKGCLLWYWARSSPCYIFSVFESTKTFLVNRLTNSPHLNRIVTDENHPLIASCAGITGTTASDALMTPFDMLKQKNASKCCLSGW